MEIQYTCLVITYKYKRPALRLIGSRVLVDQWRVYSDALQGLVVGTVLSALSSVARKSRSAVAASRVVFYARDDHAFPTTVPTIVYFFYFFYKCVPQRLYCYCSSSSEIVSDVCDN